MSSCPPPTPGPCAQVCPPPHPAPPCRVKPLMRGLHWAQCVRKMTEGFLVASIVGGLYYVLYVRPKMAAYQDFYLKAELEDWADEMARKGLFQSVPKSSLPDNQHMKK